MKTLLSRTVLAAVMFAALAMVLPGQAVAAPWCDICENTNDCLACCRCDGGSMPQCLFECGFPADSGDEVSFLSDATCDAPLMTLATPVEIDAPVAETNEETEETAAPEAVVSD